MKLLVGCYDKMEVITGFRLLKEIFNFEVEADSLEPESVVQRKHL